MMEETRLRAKILARKGLLTVLLPSLFACGLIGYLLRQLLEPLTPNELMAWAIVSTLALVFTTPGAAFVGFLFGRREASVLADGLRAGVNEVTRTADEITTFKDKAASRVRQPPVQVNVAQLPTPPVMHRQLESGETVDL